MMDSYDRFLGGWVGAMIGNALGQFTNGRSPAQVEDSYPTGLRTFPSVSHPSGPAVLTIETGEAITSRRFPRPPRDTGAGLYGPVLRALTTGLAAAPAGLKEDELEGFVLDAMKQDGPPFPAASVFAGLWVARLLRYLVLRADDIDGVDAHLYDPLEYIQRPDPELIEVKGDETQAGAWSEARSMLNEGIGAGVASLDRFDFAESAIEKQIIIAGVVTWAVVTDLEFDIALASLVSRGGDAEVFGMIGGAVLGARLGFKQIPKALLGGLGGLDAVVDDGAKLYKAAQDYRR